MAFDQKYLRRSGYFYKNARRYASRKEVMISTYLIVSLFTVSFFAVVFIRPTAVTIAKLWREIQDKKVVYTQLEKKIRNLEEAQAIFTTIEKDLVYLDRALPASHDYSRFLREIEYLGFSHGLEITSARYDGVELYSSNEASKEAKKIDEYSYTLSVKGSFSQIYSFIADFERLDRLVSLQSITIQPFSIREDINQYILSLSLDSLTYSFPEGLDLNK